MGEFFGWVFLGVLCFFGYTLFKKGYQKKYQLTVYEFENRTDGGVVKFDSFEVKSKSCCKFTLSNPSQLTN